MCILYKETCLFKYKNKLILLTLRLFLCCKHGRDSGKKIHIAFRLHWDASSIGGMFYSTFLSRNLISVSRNKLTPMTS